MLTLAVLGGCERASDASATGPDAASDGDLPLLQPISAPPAADDPHFANFVMGNPGATPIGWDRCSSCAPLMRMTTSSGKTYLDYNTAIDEGMCPPTMTTVSPAPRWDAQIYQYFDRQLPAAQAQSFWFDVMRASGDPSGVTLAIYATDSGCGTIEALGTWNLAALLAPAQTWQTSCVTLTPTLPAWGIGFAFTGTAVDFGFASPRFAPACPGAASAPR